ncbi:hypothetical protein, partial [Lactococcus lactis]|uniref:hypothetical protein n=1 Tax=Lactococcus lactis TaxID=1358 RepID=UPI00300E62A3
YHSFLSKIVKKYFQISSHLEKAKLTRFFLKIFFCSRGGGLDFVLPIFSKLSRNITISVMHFIMTLLT